jgi:hypothetical protein
MPARPGDEVEAIDACPSPAVYIVRLNGPSTITRVPLRLCEKRVELQGLRAAGRWVA